MTNNEQEPLSDELLLTPDEVMHEWRCCQTDWPISKGIAIAKAQVAKLKALGYEQVWTKCPDCKGKKYIVEIGHPDYGSQKYKEKCPTCKGTGKIPKYVKWDREKVAEKCRDIEL